MINLLPIIYLQSTEELCNKSNDKTVEVKEVISLLQTSQNIPENIENNLHDTAHFNSLEDKGY